jgi:hypothetical protein
MSLPKKGHRISCISLSVEMKAEIKVLIVYFWVSLETVPFSRLFAHLLYTVVEVKKTVSRDFLLLVFLMNQFSPSPRVLH